MKKFKKITKYVVNGLNMLNLLLLGLAQVWSWNIDKISATIVVLTGVISTYLVSGKLFETEETDESQSIEQ